MTKSSCLLFAVLLLAGCSPKEPEKPVVVVDQAAADHLKYFGDAAKAPDITWRTSGLGIRILAAGTGDLVKPNDVVRVQYIGRLKDGTVFEDSHKNGGPVDFTVSQLIIGWSVAMQAMHPGGHAEFYIPPALGYGAMRAGNIPPNSGLIFDVELLAVNPPDAKP
ncbi:MAG TPA: FKBP-type peptidyl-prolyl cis-trans isomerase [Candidatus Didemnitutus sp.]|nr:FKBP-type peptidyl-prolyl cis-trans isomerase [Candidatus Didemnitutus sp.]